MHGAVRAVQRDGEGQGMREFLLGVIVIWVAAGLIFTKQTGFVAHMIWNDLRAGWNEAEGK